MDSISESPATRKHAITTGIIVFLYSALSSTLPTIYLIPIIVRTNTETIAAIFLKVATIFAPLSKRVVASP